MKITLFQKIALGLLFGILISFIVNMGLTASVHKKMKGIHNLDLDKLNQILNQNSLLSIENDLKLSLRNTQQIPEILYRQNQYYNSLDGKLNTINGKLN